MFNLHSYTESLKDTLQKSTTQKVSEVDVVLPTEPVKTGHMWNSKGVFWLIGVCVIGVSVVAFMTQLILLAVHNVEEKKVGITQPESQQATTSDIYVLAGLGKDVFDTATTSVPTEEDMDRIDLGIPGVSRIGFDAKTPNSFLTDNINKYSNTTLVVGGREGERANMLIGGGDEEDILNQDRYSLYATPAAPILSSKAYLVADLETGEIILEKESEAIHPLASVSKLMTAIVAREKMDMQTIAIVSRDASRAYGGQGNLGLGEKIRLADLLFPLLMESSNDAAEVFADQYGHSKFMEEMNKKAVELGMTDTYYGDPSGLDPQNTSTPKDLLKLARYIHKHDPQIYDMTRVKQFSIKGHTWYNRNALLLTTGYAGGKNGYIDQSKQTTVSLFDVTLAKGGVRTVVVIVLKSDNKNGDVAKLLNYLKKVAVYEVR